MGKGFNNYMCKKFFHPASRDNLKRVWMAEQKAESYKKKQEELRMQYEKEQDLYNNKAMLSKESKDKLSVNFMYEPPPGAKKEREREDDEPEYKFEWQRKFNAPREDYCKGDSEIRDQPFGIQVRNVRCIKCHKWGHINTDKECPLFKQASFSQANNALDPLLLVQQMKEDGLAMKKSALDTQHHIGLPEMSNQTMIPSEDEDTQVTQEDLQLLKSLSTKKKLKLLRKLEKMENGGNIKKSKIKILKKKKHKSNKIEKDEEEKFQENGSKSKNKKLETKNTKMAPKHVGKYERKHFNSSSSDSESDGSREHNIKSKTKNTHELSKKYKKRISESASSNDSDTGTIKKTRKRKHEDEEKIKFNKSKNEYKKKEQSYKYSKHAR